MSDTLYEAWRRPLNDPTASWEKVPGMEPMPKGALLAAHAAIQKQMWLASEIEYEYAIEEVGKRPVEHQRFGRRQQPFSQTYRTKEMRPR